MLADRGGLSEYVKLVVNELLRILVLGLRIFTPVRLRTLMIFLRLVVGDTLGFVIFIHLYNSFRSLPHVLSFTILFRIGVQCVVLRSDNHH